MSFLTKTWVQHLGLSPEPAHHGFRHSQTYDQVRKELVMFGGSSSNQTWTMDDLVWTLKSPVFSPAGRSGHIAGFDEENGRVLVHGGSLTNNWGSRVNDINGWDGTNWTEILANGVGGNPTARCQAGGCYDAKRKKFVMCGGWYGTNNSQAVWEFDVTTDSWSYWGDGPWERRSHCRMAYDPVNEVCWLVGGYAYPQSSQSYRYRDTWKYDGSTWTELTFGAGDDIPSYVGIVNTGTQRTFDVFLDGTDNKLTMLSSYVDGVAKLGILSLDPAIPKWTMDYETVITDPAQDGEGWTLSETPVADLHVEDRKLYCFFSPSQASETYQTWSLEADTDEDSPVVENQDPASGETDVAIAADIVLDIVDRGIVVSGVDPDTVVIRVNNLIVWQNDAGANGWSGSRSTITDGFRYTLDNPTVFGYLQLVSVRVVAEDFADKEVDTTYLFTVVPRPANPGHTINVSVSELAVPKLIHEWNQFDEHAGLVSLERLRGEKNWEFKRRTLDAFVHIANCSYRGLVNGITRELGLELSNTMSISPRLDSSGSPLAPDPYIQFSGAYLLLYSDYANGLLDWAIDRYQPGGNYEHIGDLAIAVNNTSFFEAGVLGGVDLFTRSMTILNQSNREQVRMEFIPQSTRFKLKNSHLVQNSVFFSNRQTFRTEVASVALVTTRGEYHVDYPKGIITVYTTPNHKEFVKYRYSKIPLITVASPVILHDINDEAFRVKMFEQILQDDGTYAHGLPTELGVDVVNELMAVSSMYWGV